MSVHPSDSSGRPAWQAALAAAAVLGTLATACMMPVGAVATASAATLSRGRAAATVGAAWATNQLLGFALLGYPATPFSFAWGAALGGAGLLAMLVADRILAGRSRSLPWLAIAFAAAFVAYESALFAFALVVGGTGTFTAAIIARILLNDACWFAGLMAFHAILTRAAPRTFGAVSPGVAA